MRVAEGRRRRDRERNKQAGEAGKKGEKRIAKAGGETEGGGIAGKQNVQTSGKRKGKKQNSNGDLFAYTRDIFQGRDGDEQKGGERG